MIIIIVILKTRRLKDNGIMKPDPNEQVAIESKEPEQNIIKPVK